MNQQNDFSTFSNYRQVVSVLRDNLLRLKGYCEELKLSSAANSIGEMLQKSAEDSFDIAVIGEFRRGKSTLINALLGKEILPSDVLPTTATLNRVTYGVAPAVKIDYKDGKSEEIDIERLADYVTKLTDESERMAQTIRQATVCYPIDYCKNNVDIIDTPGLNDDKSMTEVTLSVIPQTDAALFVIMAPSPFSEYERDFLENKMLVSDIGRVIFVVTRIDSYDEEEAARIVDSIKNRIQKYVVLKAKRVLGEDSKEFAEYQRKLGSLRVIGLSAKQALKAKQQGDLALLEKSNFPAFEAHLEKLLTQERGAVTLSIQAGKIVTVSSEVLKAIDMRLGTLNMDKKEFNEKYEAAKAKISEIRETREKEIKKITIAAQRTYEEIKPMADSFWTQLAQNADALIDACEITADDLKKENLENTQQKLIEEVQRETQNLGQLLSEKLQNAISVALGEEAQRLQHFEENFFQSVGEIRAQFSAVTEGDGTVSDLAISTAADTFLLMGLGGAYQGFKRAGWKGALLGGGVSLGATYASIVLISALVPFTWPLAIVAGFMGAITSRFALNRIFGGSERQVISFKEKIKEAFQTKFDEMRVSDDVASKVGSQIQESFDALKEKVNSETESILCDTEAVLNDLQDKITENRVLAQTESQSLHAIIKDVTQMGQSVSGICDSIAKVLAG